MGGPLDKEIGDLQQLGNRLRESTGLGDAMVGIGIAEIARLRESRHRRSRRGNAYLIRQLKREEEVALLRRVYGQSVFILGAYAPLDARMSYLAERIALSHHRKVSEGDRDTAKRLIEIDQEELHKRYGQALRKTFPESDVFIDCSNENRVLGEVGRFVELVFGFPYHTPTRDEFSMFLARGAALRSADLGRQVGAVVSTPEGNVVGVGSNEVPKYGGGLYWTGDPQDARDFATGKNSSAIRRQQLLREVLDRLSGVGWLTPGALEELDQSEDGLDEASTIMKGTRLMQLGEFGRTVHAEMAALLDASQRGVSVNGCVLYTTTFPCHNCAKHIVAAGISRVRYIEPYPESLAGDLHGDAITIDPSGDSPSKVVFCSFLGIAPRSYIGLFTMRTRRTDRGEVIAWLDTMGRPRVTDTWTDPRNMELAVTQTLSTRLREANSSHPRSRAPVRRRHRIVRKRTTKKAKKS
jgi:cytidine deaminase